MNVGHLFSQSSAVVGWHLSILAYTSLLVVMSGEKGEWQVMALCDLHCNSTLINENLVVALGLGGKKIFTCPNLLSSLFGVMPRFCEGGIAIATDVKEMYHMLCLPERDKPLMRLLRRNSPEEEPSVYQFKRTVFGEVSAPPRENYAMRRDADENGDLPLSVKVV